MTITEKLSRLTAINILILFDKVLKENEDFLFDLNRDQMYDKGVMDVENPSLREHYAPSTIRAKKRAAFPKTDFITLKWTGDFYETLKLLIFNKYFIISSTSTIWSSFLEPQDRFGKALGMIPESKNALRELMHDELISKIKHEL